MEPMSSMKDLQQDLDTKSDRVNSDCLAVPLILREILQYFPTAELIGLSLVNKQWNYEARSVMRNRADLTASINKNQTCQDLRAFASDLRRMTQMNKIVPFAGMTISVGGTTCGAKYHCHQTPNKELESVYEEIIGSMTWKHFSLKHLPGWEEHKSCPGFILGMKILRKLDWVLQELSLQLEWNEARSFKQEFLQGSYFSRLHTLSLLNEEESFEPEWSDLIKFLVSNAPNLKILYTKECVDLGANLLEGSSAVHLAGSSYSPSLNEIPESVARTIRMHGLDLFKFSPDFNLESFNRITASLLQSSRKNLRSINIDVIFFAPLMNNGEICLENVREFELALVPLDSEEIQPHILKIAKAFDFTRMFPNLNTVTILPKKHRSIPEEFNQMIERTYVALETPAPDRVANIKNLQLDAHPSHGVLRQSSSFSLIAQLFPHVQKLSILTDEVPSADIRGVWADLKEVDIVLAWSLSDLTNLDSVFCGIFPEEVARLREEDEEYLRRVNIVPVMPSITYWKELTSFDLDFEKHGDPYTGPIEDPNCLFSKVTAFIAFQRCPNLTVTLRSEDERFAEALGHLKPYATVSFKP